MSEEKVGLIFEASGYSQFNKAVKDSELALRRQARALDESARELQKQILAAKGTVQPNRQLIASLQRQAQEAKLSAAAIRANIAALKDQAAAAKNASGGFSSVGKSISGVTGAVQGLLGPLGALMGLFSVGQLIKISDEYNGLQARIRNATQATQDYIGVSKELNRISIETGTKLEANVDLFQRLRISAEALGASNKDIVRFTESIAKLGVVSGSSPQKIADATLQLAQALAMGRPQAEEINSILEGMPAVAARIEKGLGLMPGQLKNAVKEGKVLSRDILDAILKQTQDIDDEFDRMPKTLARGLTSLETSFARFINTMDQSMGVTEGLGNLVSFLAQGFDRLSESIGWAALRLGEFLKNAGLGKMNLAPIAGAAFGPLGTFVGQFANVNADDLINIGKSGPVSDTKTKGYTPSPKGTKKKKGPSLESIEKDRIQENQQRFDDQIRLSRANAELGIAQMGPFAEDQAVLTAKLKMEQDSTSILRQKMMLLGNTTVKTKDAQKALRDAIAKTKLEMIDNAKAVQEAKNALDKYSADEGFQDFQRKQDYEAKRAEFIREQAIKGEEEQAQIEARLYEEKKLSVNAYYDDVLAHIDNKERAEKEAFDATMQRLEDEIATRKELFGETEKSQGVKAIRAQQEAEKLAFQTVQADNQAQRDKTNRDRIKDLNAAAERFGDSLEQAISTAIEDAFTGKGPIQAMKDFAKALRNILAKTIADAIAEGLRNSPMFTAISKSVGDLFNAISGRSKASAISQGGGIAGLQEGQLDLSEFSNSGSGSGLLVAGTSKKVSPASSFSFAKILAPIAGAVGSYQAGKTLGQKFGRVGGGFAGMGAGALIGGIAGSVFGPVGTILGASLGGTIGGIAGIMGGGRNKQAERAAYQQNKLAPFLSSVVSTAQANSNDLNILNAQFMAAARGMSGRGSNGMAMKRDAMTQILQLIEQRKKTIEDFIRDTARQNEELRDQIALADAKPFEKAALEHQIAIKQIEYERTQLLEQFKDSEEAKTKILEQESLKRQQLSQQESEKFKSDTQDLRELLMQRDDAANANVFTRLRSREQVKADTLSQLDQQIAQKYLELKGQLAAGVTPKDTLGLNQILGQLNAIGTQTNNLQIIINQADDPNAVREEIARAFDAFLRKSMGANVA
jgi:tape measure domain-containing protein